MEFSEGFNEHTPLLFVSFWLNLFCLAVSDCSHQQRKSAAICSLVDLLPSLSEFAVWVSVSHILNFSECLFHFTLLSLFAAFNMTACFSLWRWGCWTSKLTIFSLSVLTCLGEVVSMDSGVEFLPLCFHHCLALFWLMDDGRGFTSSDI